MIHFQANVRGVHYTIICNYHPLYRLKVSLMSTNDPVLPLTLAPEEIAFYQREGYLLLPGLLTPDTIATMREETLKILTSKQQNLTGKKLVQTADFVAGSQLASLISSEHLRQLVEQLLAGPACLYMPFTAVKSAGGGGSFEFHQDNQYTRHDGPALNMWFALQDMTPENGCLRIEPRSHLDGTRESEQSRDGDHHRRVLQDPEHQYLLRMRAGDCIAFSRLTVHGSGPNTSDTHRVGYAVQFHRHDVNALIDGEWKLLKDNPRYNLTPCDSYDALGT